LLLDPVLEGADVAHRNHYPTEHRNEGDRDDVL